MSGPIPGLLSHVHTQVREARIQILSSLPCFFLMAGETSTSTLGKDLSLLPARRMLAAIVTLCYRWELQR